MHNILKHNLHTKVEINSNNIKEFRRITKNVRIIRSAELATIAFERGLLDKYLTHIDNPRKTLLESILWGIKLNGCAVTKREIEKIIGTEVR